MQIPLKQSLVIGSAVVGLLATQPVWAQQRTFNVPAQDARHAIPEFARQAGLQISAPTGKLRGVQTKAIKGTLDARAALRAMIASTGLSVASDDGAMIVLRYVQSGAKPTIAPRQAAQQIQPRQSPGEANAGSAAADNAGAEQVADSEGEIIVTARRSEENIQNVPISITAVSQESLENNNIQTLGQLQFIVPSMSATSVFSRDNLNISIRGQQATSPASVQAVVAYLNDISLPSTIGGDIAGGPGTFFDLQNVQVLRGPQGTLFGRNTTGGAVLFVSARPRNEFGAAVQVGYGNYDNLEANAVLNVPLVQDKLLARFAAAGQLRDGFTKVLATPDHPEGIDVDDRNWYGIRGSLAFLPVDGIRNDVIVSYSRYKNHGSPPILTDVNPSAFLIGALAPQMVALAAEQAAIGDPRTIAASSVDATARGSTLAVSNATSFNLAENVTLKNIFGHIRSKSAITQDFDGTVLHFLDNIFDPFPYTNRQYSNEVQLFGKAFGERLDWRIGGFYLRNKWDWIQANFFFFARSGNQTFNKTTSKALFGQGTYDLSSVISGLKFTAGARYTWDRERSEVGPCAPPAFTDCSAPKTLRRASSHAFTWTLGLDYQLNDNTLFYIASRRGYRAGGMNTGLNATRPEFGPEYVTDLEIGVKADWTIAGMPFRVNADVDRQWYTDIQVLRVTDIPNTVPQPGQPPPTITQIENAGRARIDTAEIEATLRVTRNLKLGASFSYLNLTYTSAASGVDFALLKAQEKSNRPPYKYGLSAEYHLPLDESVGDVVLLANWNWQAASTGTGIRVADFQDPRTRLPSFGLLNLTVNWKNMFGGPLDASIFMSNATDKLYPINIFGTYQSLGLVTKRYGEPRMYGLRLRYHVGSE